MKRTALTLLPFLLPTTGAAAPEESVKFTPTVRLYECPQDFQLRSDCKLHEKTLVAQKLVLNMEVLGQRMGRWTLQTPEPVQTSYHVIVMRGREGMDHSYSVSLETGLPRSPLPFANGRVEFRGNATPASFGVSSSVTEHDGEKYFSEIRLTDFHGKMVPARAAKPR